MTQSELEHRTSVEQRHARSLGMFLLGLALVSWFLLMWPVWNAGPLVLDEHVSYWMIDSDLPGSVWQRCLNYGAVPPLSSWVQQGVLTFCGKSEFVFRLPSLLGVLGAVLACYFVGRSLRNETVGGLAALLIVWHPEAIDECRIARCYGLVLCLSAVVLLATVEWQKSPRSFRWALGWGLAGTALLWTHYMAIFLVMIAGISVALPVIWKREFHRATIFPLLMGGLIPIVLCLPLLPAVARLHDWSPYLNFGGEASILKMLGSFWWAGLPVGAAVSWLLGRALSRKNRLSPAIWTMAACGLLPVLIMVVVSSGELQSLSYPRYRVAYAPAGVCFAGLLLAATRTRIVPIIGCAAFLVAAWSFAGRTPWELGRLGSATDQQWRELNVHLADQALVDEPILVQSGLVESHLLPVYYKDPQFQEYAACRVSRFYVTQHHPRLGLPFLWNEQSGIVGFYDDRIQDWKRSPGTFWVAVTTDTDLGRNSLTGVQLLAARRGFEVLETRIWPAATLIHYGRPVTN